MAFIVETPQRLPDARNWELWTEGGPVAEITGLKPRLASWNRSDHPDQIRLREYLRDLSVELGPLTAMQPLFLKMMIDVEEPARLERHHDLDNYLTPVVAHLGPRQFRYVEAVKRVGGGFRPSNWFGSATAQRGHLCRVRAFLMRRRRGSTGEALEGVRSPLSCRPARSDYLLA